MKIDGYKLNAARKVLAELRKLPDPYGTGPDEIGYLNVFSNCREQGYVVHFMHDYNHVFADYMDNMTVAFSENRNSDDIVVYVGSREDFDITTNLPNERVWETRKYFRYDQAAEAAQYIYDRVDEHYKRLLRRAQV